MTRRKTARILAFSASFVVGYQTVALQAAPFDNNDFIVVGTNFPPSGTHIYSENLAYKGGLGGTGNGSITGYGVGHVAMHEIDGLSDLIRVYNSAGLVVKEIPSPGNNGDLKARANGNLLLARTRTMSGDPGPIKEITATGAVVRTIGSLPYRSIAVLPGNIMWAGRNNSNTIDVFDLTTGLFSTSFVLPGGQDDANSMFYSNETNTVLVADSRDVPLTQSNIVSELDATGALVRAFNLPPDFVAPMETSLGVTRGPGGDVFATDIDYSRVARWRADGTFVGFNSVNTAHRPMGIVWTGNVPEPCAGLLAVTATFCALAVRRRR